MSNPDGSITAAIRAASPGDHIQLASGVYDESVVVDRPVTIVAAVPGGAVLTPGDRGFGLRITADATIIGLAIDGGGLRNQAVEVLGGAPKLSNLTIANAGTGASIGNSSAARFSGCTFQNCRIAIHVTAAARAVFESCEATGAALFSLLVDKGSTAEAVDTGFAASRLGAVVITERSQASFSRCRWLDSPSAEQQQRQFHAQLMIMDGAVSTLTGCVVANGGASGIQLQGGRLTLTDSTLEKNVWAGLQISQQGEATLKGVEVRNNSGAGVVALEGSKIAGADVHIRANAAAGLLLRGSSTATLSKSVVTGNSVGVGVQQGSQAHLEDCDLRGNKQAPTIKDAESRLELLRVQ
jgi:hypothetical protein